MTRRARPLHRPFLRAASLLAPVLAAAALSGCRAHQQPPPVATPLFTDVAAPAGVRFAHKNGQGPGATIVETTGSGCAVFDYDNDGWLDIYLVNGKSPPGDGNHLYHNERNGTFQDVTPAAGVAGLGHGVGMGCAAGDVDGDGFLDLLVTYWGSNVLYRNRGDGTFEDATRSAGLAVSGFSTAAALSDLDADGLPDLYVTRYCEFTERSKQLCNNRGVFTSCPPYYYRPEADLVYKNLGQGRFREVSRSWGLTDTTGRGLGVVAVDYNQDGKQDLFVANDGSANFLYRNLGPGRFQNVAAVENIALDDRGSSLANMGCDFGDFLGDGTFAATTGVFQNEASPLWRYRPGIGFENAARRAGIIQATFPRLTFGVGFADLNNDGWTDLFLANGHVQDRIAEIDKNCTYEQSCSFLLNTGQGSFQDRTADAGPAVSTPTVGRGIAFGDLDNDGDVDLVVSANNRPARVLRNDHPAQNWVTLRLIGKGPNWAAEGAVVEVHAAGRTQKQFLHTSYSFASANDPRLHFGLGTARAIEWVTVRWPDGQKSEHRNLAPNQIHTLTEPGARPPGPVQRLMARR